MNSCIKNISMCFIFLLIVCTSFNTQALDVPAVLLNNKNIIFGQGSVDFVEKTQSNVKQIQKKAYLKAVKNIKEKTFRQLYKIILNYTKGLSDYEDEILYEFSDVLAKTTVDFMWQDIQVYKTVFDKNDFSRTQKVYVFVSILKDDVLKIVQNVLIRSEKFIVEEFDHTQMLEEIKNKLY